VKLSEWSQVGVWLADLVQVPRTTLQDAVRDGRLRSHRMGSGLVVVRIMDAVAWAKQHKGKRDA
jgi:excisionase family DNA binding protein